MGVFAVGGVVVFVDALVGDEEGGMELVDEEDGTLRSREFKIDLTSLSYVGLGCNMYSLIFFIATFGGEKKITILKINT